MLQINPKYLSLKSWLETLPDHFDSDGEVIYQARNTIRRVTVNNLRLVVKRYHKPALPNRIIYSTLRKPKAVRAYENAFKLNNIDIPTPEPVAILLLGKPLGISYLVTIESPLKHTFYDFREHGIEGYETLFDQFGEMVGRMHDKGVLHLDFSPGNILYDRIDNQWQIALVDINRMYFGKISAKRGCRNFARLWGKQDLIERVAKAYATQRGFDPDTCAKRAVKAWRNYWKHRK